MPFRLTIYTALELLKVVGLAAAVLAAVTAFGAVIKPLTGDAPISAAQAIKYVGLSLIPMMQYALPFAAGFGATIVFHRMAAENEVMAMAVAGLSYRTILLPVMALGVVLILIMVMLVQGVIPRVYALMGRVIAGDVTAILEHAVEAGKPVRFGDMEIWAESMRLIERPEDGTADERIELRRMMVARLGPDGAIESDISAAGAVLDLYEREGIVLIRMAMDDAVSWDAAAGNLRGFPRLEPTHAMPVPLPERTEPMAMTRSELLAVDDDPSRFPAIHKEYERLRAALRQLYQRDAVARSLRDAGEIVIPSEDRSGHSWRIRAAGLRNGMLIRGGAKHLEIDELDAAGHVLRRFQPSQAQVFVEGGGLDGHDRRLVLRMSNVTVFDPPDAARPNLRSNVQVGNLRIVGVPENMESETPAATLARAEEAAPRSNFVSDVLRRIDSDVARLHGEIVGRLAQRWAIAVTAGLLPLLGAILALNMRHAQPLLIYVVAFLPALLNLVLISSGAIFMRQGDETAGMAIMWSGNASLAILTAVCWRRLARH
ncbi:MAG: LptF/LptG family permease [Phycisphaerales bacterium]|jgi:hypothetical protein|nr:LptF/LptG family permease [Phycisphaerales bacterium]